MKQLIVIILLFIVPCGFAATVDREFDFKKFSTISKSVPSAIVPLSLQRINQDLFELKCSFEPLKLVPIPIQKIRSSQTHSVSVSIEMTSGGPEMLECTKGISCRPMKKISDKPLKFEGTDFTYAVEGNTSSLAAVASRNQSCKTSFFSILQNTQGSLQIPSGLIVLGYSNQIVLWDSTHERVWFRVNLPQQTSLSHIKSVHLTSNMRLLVRGVAKDYVVLDWLNDFALLRTAQGKILRSEFGLGSATHSDEWVVMQGEHPYIELLNNPKTRLAGTAGIVHGSTFITWEQLVSEQSEGKQPFIFRGRIVASVDNEANSSSNSLTLAVEEDGVIRLYDWSQSKGVVLKAGTDLRYDSRASDWHFMIGGPTLFRLTADGFYVVRGDYEVPSNLRSLKARVINYGTHFVTKDTQNKSCSTNLWRLPNFETKSFAALISNKPCYKNESISIFPGGASLSGQSGNKHYSTMSFFD